MLTEATGVVAVVTLVTLHFATCVLACLWATHKLEYGS